jgi:hypothetical protein
MWVGGRGALVVGVTIATGVYAGAAGIGVVAGVFPFLVLFVIGCFLA